MTCDCLARLERAMESHWIPESGPYGNLMQVIRAAQREAGPRTTLSQFDQACAWEKWAKEVAVPALRLQATNENVAGRALASRPKEPT